MPPWCVAVSAMRRREFPGGEFGLPCVLVIKRLEPGDIAVIDHADIDRVAADGLIDSGVAAVVNASPCITGRYPNGGPLRLVKAGILLVKPQASLTCNARVGVIGVFKPPVTG